ncbi:MAG: hypothetical protein ACE5JO_05750 [Candidatus Binatia bacterium]
MATKVTVENVRKEIARLIRLCRWSARKCSFGHEEDIRRQEESIATLQDLRDALGFKVPTVEDPDLGFLMVKGVYRRR